MAIRFPHRIVEDFPGIQRNFEYLETVDVGSGGGGTGPPGPAGPAGPTGPTGSPGASGGATYVQQIGDGASQSFTIAHGLGVQGVVVTVFRSTSPFDEVEAEVEHTSINTVTVRTTLVPATNAYTVVVSGPGATGGGGDANFVYDGTGSPATSWTVTHNLGKFASVMVVDTGNNVLLTDVHYVSANQLTVSFGAATSGKAYVN